jgi:hypothetical protein
MIQIKKDPWYIHLSGTNRIVFIRHPVKYFTVRIKAKETCY